VVLILEYDQGRIQIVAPIHTKCLLEQGIKKIQLRIDPLRNDGGICGVNESQASKEWYRNEEDKEKIVPSINPRP